MRKANSAFFAVIIFLSFLMAVQGGLAAENPVQNKQILVKIPAFPTSPGEKIVGVEFTLTGGRVTHAFRPKGWKCTQTNIPRGNQVYYDCRSTHSSFALTNSAKLPILSIDDLSRAGGMTFSIEGVIKLENDGGRTDSKQLKESDFSIIR